MWNADSPTEADGTLNLQLDDACSADGLITQITELDGVNPASVTTYEYDNRNRLLEEERTGGMGVPPVNYHLEYTYDQGGNRLTKTDHLAGIAGVWTQYHYDTDAEPVDINGDGLLDNPRQFYGTLNNRLMWQEVHNLPVGPDSLQEKVYYEYGGYRVAAQGNATFIVHETPPSTPGGNKSYAGTVLDYTHQGAVRFITQQAWQEDANHVCIDAQVLRITQVGGLGRARHLLRERQPWNPWPVIADTTRWSEYDGDVIYGDYVIDEGTGTLTDTVAYLPAIGQIDNITGAVTYYHADHIGTLRATTDASGALLARAAYTAFGEVICGDSANDPCGAGVPPVESRYQYAGEYGYESGLVPANTGISGLPFQHVGYRWYDPSTGRFLQRDSIGTPGGLNVYAYAVNSPVALVDPRGLQCQSGGSSQTTTPEDILACEDACVDWLAASWGMCTVHAGIQDCYNSCYHGWWPPVSAPRSGFTVWPELCPPCETGVPTPDKGRPEEPVLPPTDLPVNLPPPTCGATGLEPLPLFILLVYRHRRSAGRSPRRRDSQAHLLGQDTIGNTASISEDLVGCNLHKDGGIMVTLASHSACGALYSCHMQKTNHHA